MLNHSTIDDAGWIRHRNRNTEWTLCYRKFWSTYLNSQEMLLDYCLWIYPFWCVMHDRVQGAETKCFMFIAPAGSENAFPLPVACHRERKAWKHFIQPKSPWFLPNLCPGKTTVLDPRGEIDIIATRATWRGFQPVWRSYLFAIRGFTEVLSTFLSNSYSFFLFYSYYFES